MNLFTQTFNTFSNLNANEEIDLFEVNLINILILDMGLFHLLRTIFRDSRFGTRRIIKIH